MKIEKLTENKIRVILNTEDIPEPNLDTYTMMSKSCKTEGLFFEILQKAEKEVGFYTDGCKLLIEAFSSSEGFLVFTITKYTYKDLQEELDICKKKVKVKRKNINYSTKQSIYAFNNFDEFCSFCIVVFTFTFVRIRISYFVVAFGLTTEVKSVRSA